MAELLDYVASEGGPLLIADVSVARLWHGIENGGADYDRACDIFDSDPNLEGALVEIESGHGLLWEMEGAGIAGVYQLGATIVIARGWFGIDDWRNATKLAATIDPINPVLLGSMDFSTGAVAILWATEDGRSIEVVDVTQPERPTGELSMESAGLLIPIQKGTYQAYFDRVATQTGTARRCILMPT